MARLIIVDSATTSRTALLTQKPARRLDSMRAHAASNRRLASIRRSPDSKDRVLLDRAFRNFESYEVAEDDREVDAYAVGTIRSVVGIAQAEFVLANFEKTLSGFIETRELVPADAKSAAAMQQKVELRYGNDVKETTKPWREEITKFKDPPDAPSELIKVYRSDAAKSQIRWTKYQQSMSALADSRYDGKPEKGAYGMGMKLAIAKSRIAELCNNPVGPERADSVGCASEP